MKRFRVPYNVIDGAVRVAEFDFGSDSIPKAECLSLKQLQELSIGTIFYAVLHSMQFIDYPSYKPPKIMKGSIFLYYYHMREGILFRYVDKQKDPIELVLSAYSKDDILSLKIRSGYLEIETEDNKQFTSQASQYLI